MIGVDTNIVLRLFVADDDPEQHRKAIVFFSERSADDPASVSAVVVAELIWLLSRRYGYTMHDVATVITSLLESVNVHVQNRDVVANAVLMAGKSGVGIADLMIAGLNAETGSRATMTFDKEAARRVPGMELLT